MSYFPGPHTNGSKIDFELDLFNYATKSDLKTTQQALINRNFPKKNDLVNLKSEADKFDFDRLEKLSNSLSSLKSKVDKSNVDKLTTVPVDLNKLSDAVGNDDNKLV